MYLPPLFRFSIRSFLLLALLLLTSCSSGLIKPKAVIILEPVAVSDKQWTGLALDREGRLFVNYPRWSENVSLSVAEVIEGQAVAYPNASMNDWQPGNDPATHFICVQAVFVDDRNRLWILDPANPWFKGIIAGGPKLVQIDLATDSVVRTYHFGPDVALENSYLNDVRIDSQRGFAFITDSGEGALVVLDLKSGNARRVLHGHVSTAAEDVVLTIGGQPWLLNGSPPRVHADGIAYDANMDVVYYQALTGHHMYRIDASFLRDFEISEASLATQVIVIGPTGASDGLIWGPDNKIYISALEHNAILRTTPTGRVETVIQNKAIAWPDSFALGSDGKLYFTISRIHEGTSPQGQYGIFRITLQE